MFQNNSINFPLLRERAHNLRWATLPKDVIPLTAADPDFPSAPEISEAICSFAKDRYYSYASSEGTKSFKESMANFYVKKRIDEGWYLNSDLKKLNPDISIDSIASYAKEKGIGLGLWFNALVLDEELEKLISKRTKLICLCNPLNPTGKVFKKDELIALGKIACKHNLIILSDEIWSDIIFKPATFTSIASLDEEIQNRTITITGFSKSYGLAGLRRNIPKIN